MPKILHQTIGDIDRAVGDATKRQAQRHPGFGVMQRTACLRGHVGWERQGVQLGTQTQRGIPRCAGDPDIVAGLSAAAPQGLRRDDFPQRGHAESARSAGGVATDQRHAKGLGACDKTSEKGVNPGGVVGISRRDGGGQRGIARLRAHGGEIRQIDGERFPAQIMRVVAVEEMHPGHQHVGGDRPGQVWLRGLNQCAIIARPKDGGERCVFGASLAQQVFDQCELAGHRNAQRLGRLLSSGRSVGARRSSTPFTNL